MSLKSIFSSLFRFFKPVVVASAHEIAAVALDAVLAELPRVISGQDKFNSAVRNVSDSLQSAGKTAAKQLIEVAVQAAYNGLSNKVN